MDLDLEFAFEINWPLFLWQIAATGKCTLLPSKECCKDPINRDESDKTPSFVLNYFEKESRKWPLAFEIALVVRLCTTLISFFQDIKFLSFNIDIFNRDIHVQVNNYEITVNFFHISHNYGWYSAIVHKFTRIYPVCSNYELTKQFM